MSAFEAPTFSFLAVKPRFRSAEDAEAAIAVTLLADGSRDCNTNSRQRVALFGAESLHRFDFGCAAARDEGGGYGGYGEDGDHRKDDGQVGGFSAVEQGGEASTYAEAGETAEDEADADRRDDGGEHKTVDALAGCAEGHADADFLGAGFDRVAESAVDAEQSEQEGG